MRPTLRLCARKTVLGVGLGNIGAPLSGRIAAKFPTTVFDLDTAAVTQHAAEWGSAPAAAGLPAAAAGSDVIFTCLPNTNATLAVVETVRTVCPRARTRARTLNRC